MSNILVLYLTVYFYKEKHTFSSHIDERIRLLTPPNTDPISYLSKYKIYKKIYLHELLII